MYKWKQKIALVLAMVLVLGQSPMVYLAQAGEARPVAVETLSSSVDTVDISFAENDDDGAVEDIYWLSGSKNMTAKKKTEAIVGTVNNLLSDRSEMSAAVIAQTGISSSAEFKSNGSGAYTLDSTNISSNTNSGYYLEGLFASKSSTVKLEINSTVTSTTIYAVWGLEETGSGQEDEDDTTEDDNIKTFTVTFNTNGGSSISTQDVTEGGTATKPADPTKNSTTAAGVSGTSYAFEGWYSDEALLSSFNFSTTITANTTLYANWTETTVEFYDITLDANGGVGLSGDTIFATGMDKTIEGTLPTPTQEGYTFNGWFTAQTDGDKVDTSTTFDKDTTIYAQWTEVTSGGDDTSGGGTENGDPQPSSLTHTETLSTTTDVYILDGSLPVLSSSTHVFNGWYTAATGGTKVTVAYEYTKDTTLYAQWTGNAEYTIKFSANGGVLDSTTVDMTTKTDGTLDSLPANPKHSNSDYTFDAWYTAATGGTQVTTSYVFSANATVYAQWDDGIDSISIYDKPDKLSYNAGDKIDPTGLEIKINYDNGEYEYVEYDEDSEDDFSFSPGLSTSLTSAHTSLTVTYLGHSASCTITVADSSVEVLVNVEDYDGEDVTDATVKLYQGSTAKYTATDNDDGSYTFSSVEAGDYNLIVTYGDHVRTFLVTASSKDLEIDVELSEFAIATTVESDLSFDVLTVDGLDELALSLEGKEGEIVTVNMNFDKYVSTTEKDMIMLHKPNDEIIAQIFDVTLTKIVGYENSNTLDTTALTEISVLVGFTFEVEEDYQDRSSYSVYRKHGDVVEELTTSKNSSGEYISVDKTNNTVTVYSKNYSTYALVVNAEDGEEDDEYVSSLHAVAIIKTLNHVEITSDVPGTVEANNMFPKYGDRVYLTVTEKSGYTMVGISALDSQGNKMTVLDGNTSGSYYFTQLQNPVEVTVKYIGNTSATAPDSYSGFLDVSNNAYYYFYVYRCKELGLMDGTGNGLFEPEKVTTRAEVATILYKMAGSQSFYAENNFTDIQEGEWYYNPILWAKSVGVITGYTDGTFRPDDSVTREEIAVMFYQFAKYKGVYVTTNYTAKYNDYDSIASWAVDAVNWCSYRGLFSGFDGNIYVPSATSLRCQVAVSLVNLDSLL